MSIPFKAPCPIKQAKKYGKWLKIIKLKYLGGEVEEFLDKYGACLSVENASSITGLQKAVLLELAKCIGFVFAPVTLQPRGYEHLVAMPADTKIRVWERGTKYYTPVSNQPGYNSLTVHNTNRPYEDKLLKVDHDDESTWHNTADIEP